MNFFWKHYHTHTQARLDNILMNDNSEFFSSIPGDIPTILSFPIVATFNQLFACTALVLPSRCSSYFRRALIHRIIYFSFSLCGFNLIYSPLFQLATYQWNCVPEISLWNIRRASCKDVFQSKEPYVKISEMSNSNLVLFCRFRYPAKERPQYSNVASGLFLPHYRFGLLRVKEVTTCTFSKALVNEKAVGI